MSLFAVGGANSAIPEMHRVAVDVQHWMTDKQFADAFAISQMSPGPNVLIVTLIGYSVAGIAGALVATLAMCAPTAVLAYYVSRLLARSSHSRWPAIIQAALVPLSIGLMAASGLVLARPRPTGTGPAACLPPLRRDWRFATRLNPLWMLLAGGGCRLSPAWSDPCCLTGRMLIFPGIIGGSGPNRLSIGRLRR